MLRNMHLRSICSAFLAFALALPSHGMSQKPAITVRFHTETNARDSDTFAMPVNLFYQRRQAYLNRVPDFSEKQIQSIFPFQAKDGTWGCVFQLTGQGRIRLESLSSETRGTALVVFVGTKGGQHQVVDMVIDRPVTDGIISVPQGLTELEILALRKQFKEMGAKKPDAGGQKKSDPTDWRIDRDRGGRKDSPVQPPMPPARRRGAPEPDLPRVAD